MKSLHDVDIKQLRVFAVVVESGGFTAAEEVLGVSCSTISKAIADLEIRVGETLCRRGRGGFQLTEQGEKLYQLGNRLFSAIGSYVREVDALSATAKRVLRVAAVDNTTPDPNSPLVEGLRRMQAENQELRVDVHIMTPNEITLGLLKGELDIGVSLVHREVAGLRIEHLYAERVAPYVSAQHEALWRQEKLSANDIAGLRLATYTHREPGPLFAVDKNSDFFFCPQIEGVLMLILSGNHVGMLPDFYAQEWVAKGKIKALAIPELCIDSPIVAMSQRESPQVDLVEKLVMTMKRILRER